MCPPAPSDAAPSGTTPAAWLTPTATITLLQQFLKTQADRAALYNQLEAAYKTFQQSGAEGPYQATFGRLSGPFQIASARVREVEEAFRGDVAAGGRWGYMADVLRGVQEWEREKLRLTLTLNSLKHYSAQPQEDRDEGIGAERVMHVCGVGCSHATPPANEPTKAELQEAIKETYRQLQVCPCVCA
jgi:hypothetical protein